NIRSLGIIAAMRFARTDIWRQQRKPRDIPVGVQLTRQTYTRARQQPTQRRLLGGGSPRQLVDPTQHADAAGRTAASSAANRSVRNAGLAAGVEHGTANWHANGTPARISNADQTTAPFNEPARRPCNENERQKHNISPVQLDFEIPARPVHTRIASLPLAQGYLQPFRVPLPLCEHLVRVLPNPEQSQHWQECGGANQYGGKLMIIGSRT